MLTHAFSCLLLTTLSGKHDPAARDTLCHSKCNNHLQQSASIPSAMNALFQSQGMFDQQQKFTLQGNRKSSAAAARPRRLPTLIKILTGFGDEHQRSSGHYYEDNDRPIIVRRINRQEFIDQSTPDNPTQQAAVAAAAAVFSQSLRVYGNHRMKNVNAEWEQALVWIAGWDHNQMAQSSQSSNRGNNRGYNSTDDMEKSLEKCIKQCIDDKDSDITVTLGEDNRSSEELEMHGFVGESTLSSFFDWVTSFSFSKLSLRTMVSSESLYILTKTFQLVASSMAMYALHSIWVWTSPVISTWYTSLGYTTESPEWLLEHERELQQAKSSRARQRKKSKSKRRQQQTRKAAKQGSKQTPTKEEVQVHQKEDPTDKGNSNRDSFHSNHLARNRDPPPPDPEPPRGEEHEVVQVPASKADDSSSQLSEGIPSLITYSTTSASIYSPSFKPLPSSHFEDRDIPAKTTRQGPVFPHLPLNGLPVPTQEQRDKAANQLREFQAAQIQKLLIKKKLAQSANSGISSPTATSAQSMTSIQPKKVMRPPPGFSQPSESILPTQNDDNGGFLSNNEVFLSKLLDDDEDDGDKKTSGVKIPLSSIYSAPSMSPEPQSSLNPAAAPFIGSNIEEDHQVTSNNVKKMKKEDSWQSKPSDVSFKDNNHAGGGIKGVYGGSVW